MSRALLLEVAVLGAEAVEGVIRLAHAADEAGQDVGLGGASEAARLINIGDVELDGSVVLGGDETAGGRAKGGGT